MTTERQSRYLYSINYTDPEEELCRLEMEYLLHEDVSGKCFFSPRKIDPSRSPFIKHRLSVAHSARSLEELADRLRSAGNPYGDFAFRYFKFKGSELVYEEWRDRTAELSRAIYGDIDAGGNSTGLPTLLGLAKKDGAWLFGEYAQNDNRWKDHDLKPETNSHSLGIRTARALVNIAAGNSLSGTLVDPCCGVGTVLVEALSMGVDARGFELNRKIAASARTNLAFFGFENVVTRLDMHQIRDHFDVAIVDIPYGLFTPVTLEEQAAIIRTARRIADRMVLISFEDMDETVTGAGFRIIDRGRVLKGKFVRYIRVCE